MRTMLSLPQMPSALPTGHLPQGNTEWLGSQQLGLTASFPLYLSEPQAPCKALCQSSRGLKICIKYRVVVNTRSPSAQKIEAEKAQV